MILICGKTRIKCIPDKNLELEMQIIDKRKQVKDFNFMVLFLEKIKNQIDIFSINIIDWFL